MLLVIHFLHPLFLYGLFALALPIIIHLFSFKRYKKVYFSNFNFLASLQQQKKNSSKLKNILLLLLRLLAIAAIVIAFANPYVTPEKTKQASDAKSQVVIYADNSFSMSNTGTKGSLLEEAKKHLFDIVNTYPANTSFIFLSNDEANGTALNKEQMINLLSGLKMTAASKKLSEVFKEAQEATQGTSFTLFLVSDFQKKDCDFQNCTSDSLSEKVFLVLSPENSNNLYIKEVAFDQAFHKKDQNDKIVITLANASGKEYNNVPVSLTINDKKKSINKVNIPANEEKKIEISYQNTEDGLHKGQVEISDFPVVFDNKFYFSYGIEGRTEVLCIEDSRHNPFFQKLFSDSTSFGFTYRPANQTANMNFSKYNLIILDGITKSSTGLESALQNYVQNGGNLFILPPDKSEISTLNRLLQQINAPFYSRSDTNSIITGIETQSALFKDVFEQKEKNPVLPKADHFFHLGNTEKAEILLTDKKGFPVLVSKNWDKGQIFISAFNYSPENSDMVYHPLFVPILVNMACNINSALNTSYFLNAEKPISLNKEISLDNSSLRVANAGKTFEFIPEIRKDFSGNLILTNPQNIREAGLYEVVQDGQTVDLLAFNYDRAESQMEFCSEEILAKQFPNARIENLRSTQLDRNSDIVKEIVLEDNNKYLSFWFILLTILALLAEQIVWKRKLM